MFQKDGEVNATVLVIRTNTHLAISETLQVNTLQGRGRRGDKPPSLSRDLEAVILLSNLHALSISDMTTAL